jgi:hypothetical protein
MIDKNIFVIYKEIGKLLELNESKFEEVKNDLMLSNEGNNCSYGNILKWIENHDNQNNNHHL